MDVSLNTRQPGEGTHGEDMADTDGILWGGCEDIVYSGGKRADLGKEIFAVLWTSGEICIPSGLGEYGSMV